MPLYVGDYLADTAHLTAAEHGAYLLLIMAYWRNGSLPKDENMLRRISRMTQREWIASKDVLYAFFRDDWIHDRIESELRKSELTSARRSISGERGAHAKALKYNNQTLANAINLPEQKSSPALARARASPQSQSQEESATRLSEGVNGHALDDPAKPKRVSAESDERLLDGVSDIWNSWAASHGCPQVAHLTGQRAIHCRRRIAELMAHGYQTADEAFRFLLRHCDESFFVKGNPRKPLEFNQLLREDFVARMIEGSFKYQPQKQGRTWAS
jgi:uncharacterized protein YdaU (DUF1376 family)